MRKPESGAASVNLMWVIFLIVLVLSLAGFTYIAWRDKQDVETKLATARQEASAASTQAEKDREAIINLSEVVGFRGEEKIGSKSSVEAVKEKIDVLKGRFADNIPSDVKDMEKVTDGVVQAYLAMERKFNETASQLEVEIQTRKKSQDDLRTIEEQKNARISELESQLSDEQQRSANQKEEDNQRIANLQSQLDELNGHIREVEARAESEKQVASKEISTLKARVLSLSKKLEVLKEPDLPDGTVIASDPAAGLASIDIGGRDLLRRGTKFDVFRYGKGGVLIHKGRIEVRDVDRDTAVCGIVSSDDALDPIVKGDVVVNPLFARNMERTYVLLGKFPPSMNRAFITDRLKALGGDVAEKVSPSTDFLVLGQKEEGEFAQELTDTDQYKLADKLGVQIVRLNDIMDFIRY